MKNTGGAKDLAMLKCPRKNDSGSLKGGKKDELTHTTVVRIDI